MTVNGNKAEEPVSRFWNKINLMAEITALFRNSMPDNQIYKKALESIQKVVPFESSVLYLFNPDNEQLIEVTTYGGAIDMPQAISRTGESDGMKWLTSLKKPTLISCGPEKDQYAKTNDDALLVIPLIVENQLIGMVVFYDGAENSFRDKDVKLLTIIGDQIAVFIERSRAHRELEEKNRELEEAHNRLKFAQDDIIGAEKLKSVRELAASINHEINNPLSVITGNAEYLLYLNKNLEKGVYDRLKIIYNEAIRIADINRRLLEIQDLVTHTYSEDGDLSMLNLEKSSMGERHG